VEGDKRPGSEEERMIGSEEEIVIF